MANQFLTTDEITLEALDIFLNECAAVKVFDQSHSKRFGKKGNQIGDSLRIRKPDPGDIRKDSWAFNATDVDEQFDTLKLDKIYGSDFTLGPKELALDINSLSDQVLTPRVHRLAAEIDADVLLDLARVAHHTIGAPGAAVVTAGKYLADWLALGAKMSEYDTPRGAGKRYAFIDPTVESLIAGELRQDFNNPSVISKQNRDMIMDGYRYGFNWAMDQSVPRLTCGARGSTGILVDETAASGRVGADIEVDAMTGPAVVGEAITFAGVFAVNPVTKAAYPWLKQFRLTAAVATAGTNLSFTPAIVATGSHRNVSAAPVDNAAVTFIGAPNAAGSMQVAAHPLGMTLAFAALEPMGEEQGAKTVVKHDPKTGIGMACMSQVDIDTRQLKYRIDILMGRLVQRPEHVGVIFSG